MERLLSQYDGIVDREIIEMIFENNAGDVAKSKRELRLLAGETPLPNSPSTPHQAVASPFSQLMTMPAPFNSMQHSSPLQQPSTSRQFNGSSSRHQLQPARPDSSPTSWRARATVNIVRYQSSARPLQSRPPLAVTPLQEKLSAGVPLMIIMRGLPGSGKSTLAKQLAGANGVIISADDYFVNSNGEYKFDKNGLQHAHEACRRNVRGALRDKYSPVIVDNTNTEMWEMMPYVKLAAFFDYYLEVVEPTTSWRWEPRVLARRTVHYVPVSKIQMMLDRYQDSDVVNVPALYRMIGVRPKHWPPMEVRPKNGSPVTKRPDTPAFQPCLISSFQSPMPAAPPVTVDVSPIVEADVNHHSQSVNVSVSAGQKQPEATEESQTTNGPSERAERVAQSCVLDTSDEPAQGGVSGEEVIVFEAATDDAAVASGMDAGAVADEPEEASKESTVILEDSGIRVSERVGKEVTDIPGGISEEVVNERMGEEMTGMPEDGGVHVSERAGEEVTDVPGGISEEVLNERMGEEMTGMPEDGGVCVSERGGEEVTDIAGGISEEVVNERMGEEMTGMPEDGGVCVSERAVEEVSDIPEDVGEVASERTDEEAVDILAEVSKKVTDVPGLAEMAADLATLVLEEAARETQPNVQDIAAEMSVDVSERPLLSFDQRPSGTSDELQVLPSVHAGNWAAACAADTQRLWHHHEELTATVDTFDTASERLYTDSSIETGAPTTGRHLPTRARDLVPLPGECPSPPIPLQLRLHRSTMTSPPPVPSPSSGLAELQALFPATSETDLRHILEQCSGDVNWATNLLLDSSQVQLPSLVTPPATGEDTGGAAAHSEGTEEVTVETEEALVPYEDSNSEPDIIVESYSECSEPSTRSVSRSSGSASASLSSLAAAAPQSKTDLPQPPPSLPVDPAGAAAALRITLSTRESDNTGLPVEIPLSTSFEPPPAVVDSSAVADQVPGTADSVPGGASASAAAAAEEEEEDWPSTGGSGLSTPLSVSSADDEVKLLSVTLPASLLYQLQGIFGPTALGPRSECELRAAPAEQRTIELGVSLAGDIYRAWAASCARVLTGQLSNLERNNQRENGGSPRQNDTDVMLQRDEEMARRLQREEEGRASTVAVTSHSEDEEMARRLQREEGRAAAAPSPTPQFREIMELEQAIHNSEQDVAASCDSQAARLTRQRLKAEFPGIDSGYLDELLDMHEGSYRQVVQVLYGTCRERPLPQPALRAPPPDPALTEPTMETITPSWYSGDGLPSFKDLVSEQEVYRQKMRHAELMGNRAIRRNWAGVSQYYIEERNRLAALLEECRMRAAVTSVELRHGNQPDRLDLHQLMVDQALTVLASFIAEKQKEFARKGYRKKPIDVITGRGKNSKNGKAKIKPAVMDWLERKGFTFQEAPHNPGMLIITVEVDVPY